jgi:conserved oligomeric Golgi complex subunit 4
MSAATSNSIAPKTMAQALDLESPVEGLQRLSSISALKAETLSQELDAQLQDFVADLPDCLRKDTDEITTALACADSILASLTKIASGGTQASQEIRMLEEQKRILEEQAQDVEAALLLRRNSDVAADALSSQKYDIAAKAVYEYTEQKRMDRHTPRALAYAGEYTVQQMETTLRVLRDTLLQRYQSAVSTSNLQLLGELTPLLSFVDMEKDGVSLYLQYLQGILERDLEAAKNVKMAEEKPPDLPQSRASQRREQERLKNAPPAPPYLQMAPVYNTAVTTLRHHLPMVSHFLHKADGDAAVVQLVHVQVEKTVIPLFQKYFQDRQLPLVARNAQRIYALLEERYTGRIESLGSSAEESLTNDMDDCGFRMEVGALADVDGAMDEAALCLQHAESYHRFLMHTVREVNKARQLRHEKEREAKRLERERAAWATGMAQAPVFEKETAYVPLSILPSQTRLMEAVAELGGYYSGIERCLLLASMQRAFASVPQFCDMSKGPAQKTSLVDTCLFAARRSAQRAFATGHSGTASAMVNFCGDTLEGVLLEVMTRRAQEIGVAKLKPGDGLLEGGISLFSAPGLIKTQADDEVTKQKKVQQGISKACATMNDLEVASHHIMEVEKILLTSIEQGFPPSTEAEQLKACVKNLGPIQEKYKISADETIENLLELLKPRVRSLVTDAVGSDSTAGASFMTTSVGKTPGTVRMNYKLDDAAFKLAQISEGYMSRLCTSLQTMIQSLTIYLAPRLADSLVIGVLGTVAKRLEVSLKRCHFTALGALSLDSDIRDLLSFAKEWVQSPEYSSSVLLYRACPPLARLLQITKLLNVDDLEDVVDLISSSKRKGNWDLKLEDTKAYLNLRVEFEGRKVNELLSIDED